MTPGARAGRWFSRPGLLWKMLIPLVGMTLLVGLVGVFAIARHLTSGAESDLERDLLRRSAMAEAAIRDVRLDLADAARFGANIRGVPIAVANGDRASLTALVASVPAARTGLDLLVVTGPDGVGLVEVIRGPTGFVMSSGGSWNDPDAGDVNVDDAALELRAGFLTVDDRWIFAVAGDVKDEGRPVGTIMVGMSAEAVAGEAAGRAGAPVTVYESRGRLVATSAGGTKATPPERRAGAEVRRLETVAGEHSAVLYSPLDAGSPSAGTVAVRLPTTDAFASSRGASLRLAGLVLVAMAGIVGLGVVLARGILRQVRPLVETNRALGRGDLGARAPVYSQDELGELARGLNLMAEQLEAAHAELEMRVAARTEELERLYRQGLAAEQGRSQLVAEIVHEFRNQLLVIAGYGDLMVDPVEPDTADWRLEYGQAIGTAAADLCARVDDILDLAQADVGQISYEFEPVSLSEFFAEHGGVLGALARRGDIALVTEVPDSLPRVRADTSRLRQIVMNLMSNAVKYTPPGGEVRVGAQRVGARVEVFVADTGIGIDPEAGDRIFEPFYRTSGRPQHRGFPSTGLGLAVTKRLVEGHGGRITYRSSPGAGAAFTFTLPVVTKRRAKTQPAVTGTSRPS